MMLKKGRENEKNATKSNERKCLEKARKIVCGCYADNGCIQLVSRYYSVI